MIVKPVFFFTSPFLPPLKEIVLNRAISERSAIFVHEKFAFVKMNLFSATFELVLSERRTCSQQAENLFKFRRDPPIPHFRVFSVFRGLQLTNISG